MRLDKLLANLKYGSRSEIKKACKAGCVYVNGVLEKDGQKSINPTKDKIVFSGEEVFYKEKITLAIYKPSGYICSNRDEAYPSLLKLLPKKYQRFDFSFAGRLDYDTLGLVIVSTDGDLVHKIISPNKQIDKTYYLKTKSVIENENKLLQNMTILDGKNEYYITRATKVVKLSPFELEITICEGKFHQVKRMIEKIDNEVVFLKRIRIGKMALPSDLSIGSYLEVEENMIL